MFLYIVPGTKKKKKKKKNSHKIKRGAGPLPGPEYISMYVSDTKAKLVLSSPLEVNQKKLNLALYMHLDLKFNRPLRL